MKRGVPLPDFIADAPQLNAELEIFWAMFWELSSCRGYTAMGDPTRIPWTAIDRYAERHRFTQDAFSDAVFLLGRMDDAFIAHNSKKRPPVVQSGGVQPPDGSTGGQGG